MSDLQRGNLPIGTAVSGRAQNGGTRAAQAAGPTPADPPQPRRPTDIIRERRAREEAARLRQQEAEAARLRQQLQQQQETKRPQEVAGSAAVNPEVSNRRPASGRPDSQAAQSYNIGAATGQPGAASSRRQENAPLAAPAQPQPAGAQQAAGSGQGHTRISSNTQQNRTEAYDRLNLPATANPPSQPSASNPPPPNVTSSGAQQPRAGFPHAFERWETLSSHWEGLTNYWIRRLQENTNELNGRPIDQQMSRQITDLSAAGANLFHAVVELQRLRASSERKFQRWFFETRNEQEQAAEREAQLERQLVEEREARTQNTGSIDAVRAERARAEELVREMRRELQISKEEARRAWEELGRREQEERERTIALRNGEPTTIGGVQVVPMPGLSSRQASSAHRPQTRDGSFGGGSSGPGPGVMGGQMMQGQRPPSRSQTTTTSLDSPGEEGRQFTYQPGGQSPTSTDPFTEPAHGTNPPQLLRHEQDTQFYNTPPRQTQPTSSSAAIAAARAAVSPPRQPTTTNGRFYQQPDPQTTIHNPLPAIVSSTSQPQPPRSSTAQSDVRSYIQSTTGSSLGEEEYHINPDGSYTLDSRGRRIPYHQPLVEEFRSDDEQDDEDDYEADIERERMYAQQYGISSGRGPSQPQPSVTTAQFQSGNVPRTNAGALPSIPQGRTAPSGPAASATATGTSQPHPSTYDPEGEGEDTYGSSGVPPVPGAGWENITPRHRHPTRLSDIIEEATTRTSPSRLSGLSGPAPPGTR